MNFVMLRLQYISLPGNPAFSFVSNRLASLIYSKSLRREWNFTYYRLPLGEVGFNNGFTGKLVSSKGVILITKDF